MDITIGIPDSVADAVVKALGGSQAAVQDAVAALVATEAYTQMRSQAAAAAADAVTPPVVVGGTISAKVTALQQTKTSLQGKMNAVQPDPDDPDYQAEERARLQELINEIDAELATLS